MIINVTYGNAEGIGSYIQGPAKEHGRNVPGTEDRARIIEDNGFGFPIHTQDDVDLARAVLRRDVELQASNTKPIENTAIHSSMSWPPGYHPTREEMIRSVDGLAKAWSMEGARRITWSHNDTEHDHIHTWWGAVNQDTGYAWHDHERNDRAQREAIRQEREYGPLPPTRQRDHDKAAAAEASDHARTLELSKNIDGSISRRSLDRALSLGGHFGSDKTAQRNEFINQNELTKFQRHRGQAYASREVAAEKRDYIRENREASSSLVRAYSREAKGRACGVFRLYEDHSFEKTSKPPAQAGRERSMGVKDFRINDLLDWPWNKAGEVIRKWRDERNYRGHVKDLDKAVQRAEDRKRANRNFGKEVEEKGWDDPGVRRQWEKRYGRDKPMPAPQVMREIKIDEGRKGAQTEHARLKNWQIQRERRDKEEGYTGRRDSVPPWIRDEERSAAYREQKQLAQEEKDSRPLEETPLAKWYREQMARERPEHYVLLPGAGREAPSLPRPQEIPMPQLQPDPDKVYRLQGRETKWDKEFREREREGKAERRFQDGIDKATNRQEPEAMSKDNRIDWVGRGPNLNGMRPHEQQQEWQSRDYGTSEGKLRDSLPGDNPGTRKTIEENWKRDLEKINKELGKEQAERPEQGRELPRSLGPLQPTKDVRDTLLSSATGRHHDPDEYIRGKGQPHHPVPAPGPSEETIERMNKGLIDKVKREAPRWKDDAEYDQEMKEWRPEATPVRLREESRGDGAVGKGRQDRTEAGKPGILPGGSHEHGNPTIQFRRQLDESLGKIKLPEPEIGKDRERER